MSIYDNTPVRLEPDAVKELNCWEKNNTWRENLTNLNTKFQDQQSRNKMKWRTEVIFKKERYLMTWMRIMVITKIITKILIEYHFINIIKEHGKI